MGSAKQITPHTFRHSAATLALSLGSDLSTVAELLRHLDLNTTRKYVHLVDERRREAVRRLAVAIPPEILAGTAAAVIANVTDAALVLADAPHQTEAKAQATSSNVVALPVPQKPLDAQYDLGGAADARDDMATAA